MLNQKQAYSLLSAALAACVTLDNLSTQVEKSRTGLSKSVMDLMKGCDNAAQFEGYVTSFKGWLRQPEGQSMLKSSGLKLEERKDAKSGEKTYKLPAAFTQAVSNIRNSLELSDKGVLINEKGEHVKARDATSESELRGWKMHTKATIVTEDIQKAAAQGGTVRLAPGKVVDARDETVRRDMGPYMAILGTGVRTLDGKRLETLFAAVKALSETTSGLLAEQTKEREAAKAAAKAAADAEEAQKLEANKAAIAGEPIPAPRQAPSSDVQPQAAEG